MTAPRDRLGRWAFAVLLVVAVAGVAAVAWDRSRATEAHPFAVMGTPGELAFSADPGVVGIAGLAGLQADAPFTLLDVRLRDVDGQVEVLAVRAIFHGRGTTPNGYRMFGGYPLGGCWRRWPVDGFGPSYPVQGLRLARGDVIRVVFYVRAERPGVHRVAAYELDYRDADGRTHTAEGEGHTLEMHLGGPAEQAGARPPRCDADRETGWVLRAEGFPG